jgi:hypothetical protein
MAHGYAHSLPEIRDVPVFWPPRLSPLSYRQFPISSPSGDTVQMSKPLALCLPGAKYWYGLPQGSTVDLLSENGPFHFPDGNRTEAAKRTPRSGGRLPTLFWYEVTASCSSPTWQLACIRRSFSCEETMYIHATHDNSSKSETISARLRYNVRITGPILSTWRSPLTRIFSHKSQKKITNNYIAISISTAVACLRLRKGQHAHLYRPIRPRRQPRLENPKAVKARSAPRAALR